VNAVVSVVAAPLYDYNLCEMKRPILHCLVLAWWLVGHGLGLAQGPATVDKAPKPAAKEVVLPPGLTEEMLAPPPMPRFMLEKPAKPLTVEEMVQQAREAEKSAGVKREAAKKQLETETSKPQGLTKP
jgi:hypothetical protein